MKKQQAGHMCRKLSLVILCAAVLANLPAVPAAAAGESEQNEQETEKEQGSTPVKSDLQIATERAEKKVKKKKAPVSVTLNHTTWYFTKDAKLRAFKKGKKYYYKNKKAMSKADAKDFSTLLSAEKIVSRITKPGMSKKKKRSICFRWVMKKYYATHRTFRLTNYWPATYAMDHFNDLDGDCVSDAAAFAYLAAACGYKKVYVCLDANDPDCHAWTEINHRVYDPLFAQAKSYSRNYNATYKTYRLYPAIRVPIPYASTKSREASKKRYTNRWRK